MALFATRDVEKSGVPNAPSTQESQEWADRVLLRLGTLRHAQRVIDLLRADLIEFVDGSATKLCFRTSAGGGLREDADVAADRWMSEFAMSQDEPEYRDLASRWPQVQSVLRANVRTFEQHYIGYETTPELDDYYHRLAVLHARRSFGHEAFAPYAEFDGLPFGAFAATAIVLVGWSLKHMAFATELCLMNEQLDVRNVLVPWSPIQSKAKSLAAQLEMNNSVATRALRLFAGTPALFKRYAGIHDAPLTPLVPVARNQYLFSLAGAQILPYELLLRRLREEHPSDYFRHVDQREADFREDLRWVLPIRRVHYAVKPISLRSNGKVVTDVDSTVLVKTTGTLGLFQLKWQDPFGTDVRERRSRMTNLVPAANRWIQTVSDWIATHGADALVKCCQFTGDVPKVSRVVLFVIGRYHCNFSRSEPDSRAVWCTWAQLVRAIDNAGVADDPLTTLHDDLRRQLDGTSTAVMTETSVLQLRDFVIETHYERPLEEA